MLYQSREKVINFFADYSTIVSEARHTLIYGKGLKVLTSKQVIQVLPTALAHVQAANASENLLNEIRQIIHSFIEQRKLLKKYRTIQ